jgi:predicted AAA+ superfamily ATPase
MSERRDLAALIERAHALLDRLEHALPAPAEAPDWKAAHAFRWRVRQGRGRLVPVPHIAEIRLEDLQHIDRQKKVLDRNTRAFLAGKPANNVLMTGARGTGKSSLVRAVLMAHARRGLRLIEVDRQDLGDLPEIIELIADRPEHFVLFCDDLSFEEGDVQYKALKSVLDGSVAAPGGRVLVYATSNRRHLMPERMSENRETRYQDDGEIHPGEAVEEKISLSERFGLWLSFQPFRQDDYLDIVAHWLASFGCTPAQIEQARAEALQWTLERGSRSGRVALQFARDYAARQKAGR